MNVVPRADRMENDIDSGHAQMVTPVMKVALEVIEKMEHVIIW